jgi:hypothetical protein
MSINQRPPGLLSRRMFPIYRGSVIVEERWDIEAPGCPLIESPWGVNSLEGRFVKRQREMTEQEFRDSKIELF